MLKKIVAMFIAVVVLSGCSTNKKEIVEEKQVAVNVLEAKETEKEVDFSYLGLVDYNEKLNLSFKTTDRLAEVYVKEGQEIKKGDKLAMLETKDILLNLKTLEAQLQSAQAAIGNANALIYSAESGINAANSNFEVHESQYKKAVKGEKEEVINRAKADVSVAEKVYNQAKNDYENINKLYESGAASKSQNDQAKINLNQAETAYTKAKEALKEYENGASEEDLSAAKSSMYASKAQIDAAKGQKSQANASLNDAMAKYKQAEAQVERQKILLEDAILYAENDGYIMKLPFKVGEIVPAGAQVVILRDNSLIVKTGVSSSDIDKIKVGQKAIVEKDEKEYVGEIFDISDTIDVQTRTYTAKIKIVNEESKTLQLGEIVKIVVESHKKKGIWLPFNIILSDGEKYVFVIKDERATKKYITINEINKDFVNVAGVDAGDFIVTKGSNNLEEGTKVKIVE